VASAVQVVPAFVVRLITPPSPTSTHVLALVQAMESMSALDGTQSVPPFVVV
jgi:hypothetical protein